jgi:sugar phosphate isomerase/epimerase
VKLGLLTAAFPQRTLGEVAAWAGRAGFEALAIDWGRFVGALRGVGYDHVISVEHEDEEFEGSDELVERGFELARDTLRPLVG